MITHPTLRAIRSNAHFSAKIEEMREAVRENAYWQDAMQRWAAAHERLKAKDDEARLADGARNHEARKIALCVALILIVAFTVLAICCGFEAQARIEQKEDAAVMDIPPWARCATAPQ